MGVLDDAIREHLDLKRRRGGDPAEIEKAERDALGPVRREPTIGSLPEDLTTGGSGQEQPASWDEPAAQEERPQRRGLLHRRAGRAKPADEPGQDAQTAAAAAEEDVNAGFADAPWDMHEPPEPGFELASDVPPHSEPADGDVDLPAPASERIDAPPARSATPGLAGREPDIEEKSGETVEYDVEGSFTQVGPPGDEDVLEETPEFLQDTPDHDRLWFEQRPPKDFDFEG